MKRLSRATSVVLLIVALTVVGALVASGTSGMFRRFFASDDGDEPAFPSAPGREGATVAIAAGPIPVTEFLRALADMTGLATTFDRSDRTIARGEIDITAPIAGADAEMIRAILEANGYAVRAERLPSGRDVLRVRSRR